MEVFSVIQFRCTRCQYYPILLVLKCEEEYISFILSTSLEIVELSSASFLVQEKITHTSANEFSLPLVIVTPFPFPGIHSCTWIRYIAFLSTESYIDVIPLLSSSSNSFLISLIFSNDSNESCHKWSALTPMQVQWYHWEHESHCTMLISLLVLIQCAPHLQTLYIRELVAGPPIVHWKSRLNLQMLVF